MDREPLGQIVRRGAWTVTACHIVSQLISVAVLAVLYRLLSPGDFGVFAIALVVINFARIFSTWGLGIASLQDHLLTDEEQSQLLYHGMWIATGVGCITLILGYPISWLFGEPVLAGVLVLPTITLLLSVAGIQHQARLERKLLLGRLAVCRLTAQALGSFAAICFALRGLGVWALALQYTIEGVSLVVLLWIVEPWRPVRVKNKDVNIQRFRKFGNHYTASSLMFWIAQNADTLVIGMLGGKLAVGLYSQAYNLMMKPVLLVTTPVTSVMLPTLSRAAGSPEDYRRLLPTFYRFVGQLLLPCSVGVFLIAEDLMVVLGGEAWRPAGLLLRALSPVIAVQGLINISGSVFASVGRADRLFAGSAVITLLICQGIGVGWWLGSRFGTALLGGPLGVAIAYSAVCVLAIFLPYLWFCLKTVGVPIGTVLSVLVRPILAAAAMGIAVWMVQSALDSAGVQLSVQLAVGVAVGVVVYASLMWRDIYSLFRSTTPAVSGH